MKLGDTITIYNDPITKKQPEGEAKLLRLISEEKNQDFWKVKFLSDGHITTRWVEKTNA